MDVKSLDQWWVNLTIAQKEHIATKVKSKGQQERVIVNYPECTNVWNGLTHQQKDAIHEHCLHDHNFLMKDWKEGKSMSY